MPITYDITKDFLYQEGEQREKKGTVTRMLRSGELTVAQIARFADVSASFVQQIAQELAQ